MKKVILALIETSTAYGLPNIVRSRRLFNKLFWLTFIVLSLTAATYYIVNDLIDYYNYEVVTTVKTEYDQPTEFPTISFCSNQRHLYDIYPILNRGEAVFSGDADVYENPNNHHESFFSPFYGKCFRFNSGKNMTNHSIAIKNSTSGGIHDFYQIFIYAPRGLIVWIHNKSSIPSINRGYFILSAGLLNYIQIERTFESKLEEPFNNCLKDVSKFKKNKTLIDYFLNRKLSYSQENCLDLCFDLHYIKENPCKCKEAELGNVLEKCFLIEERGIYLNCTWQYRTNFTKNDLVEKCSDYCPLECDSMTFSYSISTYNRSNADYSLHTDFIVYYKTLKYTKITQQAKIKPEQLISNLGSYLGLFVGLSFVTIFEITEIIIEIIFILSGKSKAIQTQFFLNHANERFSRLESEIEKLKLKLESKSSN